MKRSRPAEVRFPESGICAIESRHTENFRMDWTGHSFPKILYACEGAGSLWTKGTEYRLKSGRIALIPKGIRHRIIDDPRQPLSIYILCIRTPLVGPLLGEDAFKSCRVIDQGPLGDVAKRLFREVLYEQTMNQPGAALIVLGKVLELIGILVRWQKGRAVPSSEKGPRTSLSYARVTAFVRSLEHHFYRPQNLETAAAGVDLRPRRFSQLFRMITGRSWAVFLRERRIEHAKLLLAQTDRSVIAVCFECGFEELSTFYRAFGRVAGTSPKAWRERIRRRSEAPAIKMSPERSWR